MSQLRTICLSNANGAFPPAKNSDSLRECGARFPPRLTARLLDRFPDKRRGTDTTNATYPMADMGMLALSVLFMQSPSSNAEASRVRAGVSRLGVTLTPVANSGARLRIRGGRGRRNYDSRRGSLRFFSFFLRVRPIIFWRIRI